VWQAKKEAQKIVSDAKREITEEREQAIQEAKKEISELIIKAVEKIIEEKVDAEKDRQIIEKTLKEIT